MAAEWDVGLAAVAPSSHELIIDRRLSELIKASPKGEELFDELFGSSLERTPPLGVFFLRALSLWIDDAATNLCARDEFARVIPLRFIAGNARGFYIPGTSTAVSIATNDLIALQSLLVACQTLVDTAVDMLRASGIETFSHGVLLRRAGVIQRELNGDELQMHANQLLPNDPSSRLWVEALRFLTTNKLERFPGWQLPRSIFSEIDRPGSTILQLSITREVYQEVRVLLEPFLGGAQVDVQPRTKRSLTSMTFDEPILVRLPTLDQKGCIGEHLLTALSSSNREILLQPYRSDVPVATLYDLCDLCGAVTTGERYQPRVLVLSALSNIRRVPNYPNCYSTYTFSTELSDASCEHVRVLIIIGAEQLDLVSFSDVLRKLGRAARALTKVVLMFDSIVVGPMPLHANAAMPLKNCPQFFCPVVEALLYSSAFSVLPGLPVRDLIMTPALALRNMALEDDTVVSDPASLHLRWITPADTDKFTNVIIDLMEEDAELQQKQAPIVFVDTGADFSWNRDQVVWPALMDAVQTEVCSVFERTNQPVDLSLCPQFYRDQLFRVGSIVSWRSVGGGGGGGAAPHAPTREGLEGPQAPPNLPDQEI